MILSSVCWPSSAGTFISIVGRDGDGGHTSQFSRINQRPPATDLSGPKASVVSLTPRSSNLAVATAVDLQLGFSSLGAGSGLEVPSGPTTSDAWSGTADGSVLSGGTVR